MDTLSATPYVLRAGSHPEIAALASLLAQAGVVNPQSGAPLDESTVLGISGGLGIGYILWEFKAHDRRIMVMGFRNAWQYAEQPLTKLRARLGVQFSIHETGGAKSAQRALDDALDAGKPAMLWVDPAHLPYMLVPPELDGCLGHTLVAYGRQDGGYLVDDRAQQPFAVDAAALATARGRISSYKNRLATVDGTGAFDLAAAMQAGIEDCAAHLAQPSESFSLPVLRKWARMMTDSKNAKGWHRVFADGKGLFSTLVSLFDNVSAYGATGGSLRARYADFLLQAAQILDRPALREPAELYHWLDLRWANLGEVALPTSVAPFAQAKELLARRSMTYTALGGSGQDELDAIGAEFAALTRANDTTIALDDAQRTQLFEAIQAELYDIHTHEVRANALLRAAIA